MNRPVERRREHGAVLIVALVLLVVLTLLGVSVMNMTQLEERMASNIQELNQSFHTAETGLSQAYSNANVWNPNQNLVVPAAAVPGSNNQVGYTVSYITSTGPPPGYDLSVFRTGHFDFQATGTSASNYTTVLHGGGFSVFRDSGFEETNNPNVFGPPP